jgi:cyclin-dependent kinase 8/11
MEGDTNGWQPDPMRYYRSKRDNAHQTVASKYKIVGFISSGTYGRVYKAVGKDGGDSVHAIKKFKPDKEGDVVTYTGISQSAIREIAVRPPSSRNETSPDYASS